MKVFLNAVILVLLLFASVQAAEIKVAVLPFEINAPQDLSYVREGIQDMLSTRFYVPGKVIVIDETEVRKVLKDFSGPLNEKNARELGRRLGADYVIFGSLTTFGQKASLDAKLVPVKEEKPPLALYVHTDTLDDLIPKLADFARRGVAYIEGRPVKMLAASQANFEPSPGPPSTRKAELSVSTPSPPAPADPTKMHPERVFRSQVPPPSSPAVAQAPRGPQGQAPKEEVRASRYKYSDIDPWPDYPPEEEDLQPLILEEKKPQKPKKKKKSFWSKLWPGNWFGGDEEETIITPSGSVPPPPPPPGYQAQVPSPPASSTPVPPPPPPNSYEGYGGPQGYQPPPPAGKTWEWY